MKKFFKEMFRFVGALLALVRGIMVIAMLIMVVVSIYLINMTAHVTINQYNETLTWKNTAYKVPLAEIEPTLVSNVVDTDIITAASAWDELDSYLDSIKDGGLERDKAQAILDEAVQWQEVYGLKSDAITRLSLYLELEDAIPEAYSTMDLSRLKELSASLYSLELEERTATGQEYMARVAQVASDFADAKKTVIETIGSIGTFEDGVWTVPYGYSRTDLTDVLEKLKSLEKFPALYDSENVLSDIADVLNTNKDAREYFEYQQFIGSVEGLTRSDYVAVSSVYTYGDALAYGCRVDVPQWEGYSISMDSPVTGLYHDGERLASDEYIRKNAQITAEIDPIYELLPEPEPEPETDILQEGDYEYYE